MPGSLRSAASVSGKRPPCWFATARAQAISMAAASPTPRRSEEHTSELQSPCNLVCRLLLEKKKKRVHLAQVMCHLRHKLHLCKDIPFEVYAGSDLNKIQAASCQPEDGPLGDLLVWTSPTAQ